MRKHLSSAAIATSILIAAAFFGATVRAEQSAKLVIASDGATEFTIVTPAEPAEAEKYAAEELQAAIEKISGAKPPIMCETDSPRDRLILIGATTSGMKAVPDSELAPLGEEGFIARTAGGNLILRGLSPRATLYAVYSLLEDRLGARWYAPGVEKMPKMKTVEFDSIDYSQRPAYEYRSPYFNHGFDGDWSARNRVNGSAHNLSEKHGGRLEYLWGFVHTIFQYVPPDKYFSVHPEYFSEIDGERVPNAQLCITNPDVRRIIIDRAVETAAAAGGKSGIIEVSQMDNVKPCQCEQCRAAYRRDGSVTATYLKLINEVAAAVAKFPNVIVGTLAYQFTEEVPVGVVPAPNVNVRLCHMAPSCETHPLGKCVFNHGFTRNLRQWNKLTDRLYIWDYYTDFHNYLMPFPNIESIKSDFAYFSKYGAKGFFAQGNGQSVGGDLVELKTWLIAKLLWNPAADADALIDEFVTDWYGPAAPAMRKYIAAQAALSKKSAYHIHLYTQPSQIYLPVEFQRRLDAALDEAETLAAADPVFAERVRRERLSMHYLQVAAPRIFDAAGFPEQNDREKMLALFERFKGELRHFGVTRLHEMEPIEETLERIRKRIAEH